MHEVYLITELGTNLLVRVRAKKVEGFSGKVEFGQKTSGRVNKCSGENEASNLGRKIHLRANSIQAISSRYLV